MFDEVTFNLPGGKTFVMRTKNSAKDHPYIQRVTWNNKAFAKTYIEHNTLLQGGVLEFTMGAQPGTAWGTNKKDWPSSANQ